MVNARWEPEHIPVEGGDDKFLPTPSSHLRSTGPGIIGRALFRSHTLRPRVPPPFGRSKERRKHRSEDSRVAVIGKALCCKSPFGVCCHLLRLCPCYMWCAVSQLEVVLWGYYFQKSPMYSPPQPWGHPLQAGRPASVQTGTTRGSGGALPKKDCLF